MTTSPRRRRSPLLRILSVLAAALLAGACDSAVGPSTSAAPSQNAVDLPTSGPGGGGAIGGGGSSGNTGGGIIDPAPGGPAGPGGPATGGGAQLVRPRPGQANLHPVVPIQFESSIDGRHVLVKVSWYSGVEPCSVLDSVKVETSGSDISISPIEGSGAGDVACIDIAVLKATIVDLGELAPGTWHIVDPSGNAPSLELTIT